MRRLEPAWYHVRSHVPTKKLKLIGRRPKQIYEDISNSRLRRCSMWDFPTEKTNKTYTSTRTLYHTPKNHYILALKSKKRSAPCFVNAAVIPLVDLLIWWNGTWHKDDKYLISLWRKWIFNGPFLDFIQEIQLAKLLSTIKESFNHVRSLTINRKFNLPYQRTGSGNLVLWTFFEASNKVSHTESPLKFYHPNPFSHTQRNEYFK